MRLPRTSRRAGQLGRLGIGLVVVVCLSIVLQMLGVPAPLLNAGESLDAGEASVSEGFSLLTICSDCIRSSTRVLVPYRDSSFHVPILAASLFHPPLIQSSFPPQQSIQSQHSCTTVKMGQERKE